MKEYNDFEMNDKQKKELKRIIYEQKISYNKIYFILIGPCGPESVNVEFLTMDEHNKIGHPKNRNYLSIDRYLLHNKK